MGEFEQNQYCYKSHININMWLLRYYRHRSDCACACVLLKRCPLLVFMDIYYISKYEDLVMMISLFPGLLSIIKPTVALNTYIISSEDSQVKWHKLQRDDAEDTLQAVHSLRQFDGLVGILSQLSVILATDDDGPTLMKTDIERTRILTSVCLSTHFCCTWDFQNLVFVSVCRTLSVCLGWMCKMCFVKDLLIWRWLAAEHSGILCSRRPSWWSWWLACVCQRVQEDRASAPQLGCPPSACKWSP